MEIDFLISYEHKSRELESILLLKLELEKRGYTVMLHGLYEKDFMIYHSLKKYKPHVVIIPAAYDYSILSCFAFNIVGLVPKIVNLQWEQVLTLKEEDDLYGYHNPKGLAKQVVHLCWGYRTKERLLKCGIPDYKTPITGPVHLDLLSNKFEPYFVKRQDLSQLFNLDCNKKWILFISSFSYCSISQKQLDEIAKSYGMDDTNYFKKFSLASKDAILTWFEKILEDNADYLLVYRPHPEEKSKDLRLIEMEKKYSNFRVIPYLALKHWIFASDIIYNWYSTSMADIYFSHKKCYILRPIDIELEQEVSIFRNAQFISSYDDFSKSVLGHSPVYNSLEKGIMESYYDLNKTNPSYNRVCDILEDVYHLKKYDIKYPFKTVFLDKLLSLKKKVGNFLLAYLPSFALNNIPYLRLKSNERSRVGDWYSKSFKTSVASNDEVTKMEQELKSCLKNE